jgi:hypothetical protein
MKLIGSLLLLSAALFAGDATFADEQRPLNMSAIVMFLLFII